MTHPLTTGMHTTTTRTTIECKHFFLYKVLPSKTNLVFSDPAFLKLFPLRLMTLVPFFPDLKNFGNKLCYIPHLCGVWVEKTKEATLVGCGLETSFLVSVGVKIYYPHAFLSFFLCPPTFDPFLLETSNKLLEYYKTFLKNFPTFSWFCSVLALSHVFFKHVF